LALTDDLTAQTGQPDDDTERSRRMMEFVLRSALKPPVGPLPAKPGGANQDAGPWSEDVPAAKPGPPTPGFDVRPNLRPSRLTAPPAPDSDVPTSTTSLLGRQPTPSPLGRGRPAVRPDTGGLDATLPQPARPNVQPMRTDFPNKPLPTWEKVLGVAAAPFMPSLSAAIFTGPGRRSTQQYNAAVTDWERGQTDAARAAQTEEATARTEETRARTKSLLNPQPKEGQTPEETTLADLMTGNNGGPQINPDTGKPFTRLEAFGKVEATKAGAAQGGKQPPLDQTTISQINAMHTERFQQLNPGKPLSPALTLRPGATQQDYERIDKNLTQMESAQGTQAQREANNAFRQQSAANAAQDREAKREEKYGQPVYAYDPDKKQTILTTQGAATQGKLQAIRKVSQPDIEKDTDKLRQIGDAQMNVSAYRGSLTRMNALSGSDLARVAALVGDDKFKLHFMGMEIPVDWYNQLRDNQKFNDLPEDAKDAVVGYIGARGSIIAYTKAISGTARLTESQLQTEMQNLPRPSDPQDVAERKFARFQRNIDQAASGLPKIPGIDTPAEIRAKTEVSPPAAPQPQPTAQPKPKSLRGALTDFLNKKMGAR